MGANLVGGCIALYLFKRVLHCGELSSRERELCGALYLTTSNTADTADENMNQYINRLEMNMTNK
jgi:hypothetical protein